MLTSWLQRQKRGETLAWLNNRNLLLITLASAFSGFTVDGGIFSVIFNLYLVRLHYTSEVIGQINSVAELTLAVSALPAGALGGRWGSRTMMIIGAVLMTLGCVVIAATGMIDPALRLTGLMVGKSVLFLGLASFYVNSVPFTTAASAPKDRPSAFAAQSALSNTGAVLGALIGGALPGWYVGRVGGSLADPTPYLVPLWLVAVVMALFVLVVLGTKEPDGHAHEDRPAHSTGAPSPMVGFMTLLVVMTAVRFFQIAGIGSVTTFYNVYLDKDLHVPTEWIGAITAAARLLAIPAVLLVPWLSRRWSRPGVSFAGAMLAALCTLPLALSPVWWVAGASYIVFQAGVTIRYSAYIVYLMERTPAQQRGVVAGAGEMAAGLSVALAAFLGGYMIAWQGYPPLFLLGGLLMAAGTLLFGWYVRRWG